MGIGNNESQNEPKLMMKDENIKMISCGSYHSIILKKNGELFVFGNHKNGRLGLGKDIKEDQLIPKLMVVDDKIELIICGFSQNFIFKKNGELIGFGFNSSGQLGIGNNENQFIPKLVMIDKEIKSISCGSHHSMILKENGEVFVFGYNYYGQLGIGNNENQNKPILLMKDDSISILIGGKSMMEWSHENHIHFPDSFKKRILLFVLFLKRNQIKTGLKIPKFVLFEIIKKTI